MTPEVEAAAAPLCQITWKGATYWGWCREHANSVPPGHRICGRVRAAVERILTAHETPADRPPTPAPAMPAPPAPIPTAEPHPTLPVRQAMDDSTTAFLNLHRSPR